MKLLDLFCGAGGAAMGYYQAGFTDITGIDIKPQKRYPFKFIQGDALEYLERYGAQYEVVHASPPCQAHSQMNTIWKKDYEDFIEVTRNLLDKLEKPYIIENVAGSTLINPLMLCGTMFGLRTIRHRLFETNPLIYFSPATCCHWLKGIKAGSKPNRDKDFASVIGHFSDIEYAKQAMGIDWMIQDELAQAIPPAYTKWIGEKLLEILKEKA